MTAKEACEYHYIHSNGSRVGFESYWGSLSEYEKNYWRQEADDMDKGVYTNGN